MTNSSILGPVFIPLVGAVVCLLLARSNRVQRYVGLAFMIVAWLFSVSVLLSVVDGGVQVYRIGGWSVPYGIALAVDMLNGLFGVMASTVMTCGVLYIVGSKDKSANFPAFMPLMLGMATGLAGAFYTGDIFTLFVFVELMVITSVGLTAISDNRLGLEAAIKYLLISAMGTLLLLLGIGAIYASFGSLNLADIAQSLETGQRPLLAQVAALMLMSAFLLKSAVFPFHFWQPDFHTTSPTAVSAMLSSVIVKVGVYGLIRLTTLLFIPEAELLRLALLALGIVGIFFGGLGAFRTNDVKRMLAYSTFGQIGFILVGIGWGTPLALAAAIIYAVNHALIKSSLLMLTGVVSSRLVSKSASFSKLQGVGLPMKWIGILYFVGGLSLAGVPPLNGFISKLALVQGGIGAEGWIPLILAIGGGILTLMYMVRTWQYIFYTQPAEEPQYRPYGDSPLAPALLIALCVVLGIYATPLVSAAQQAAAQLATPNIYIAAVLGN
ncbi:MAG: hypothetical protein IPK19_33850 [Chloroflexi bacterium]|nr:hypothetical protein [Chloroflexota bacterium]